MPYAYPIWLVLCVGLPLAWLWLRYGAILRQHTWALSWTTLGALVLGWLWNAQAVRANIWYYTQPQTLGVWFLGLPLEEWLWMSGVSLLFACVTIIFKETQDSRQN